MAENNRPPGYEATDADALAVGRFGVALLLVIIASLVLLFGLFRYFDARGPVAVTVEPTKVFPQPQLERTPIPDLRAVRAAEDQMLNSYGWVDPPKGVVRIPIGRAIDLLAERGLPSRAAPPAASGVSVPTASGLGSKMQQPGGPLAGESK
ncbi:MAG: hypothetical protein LAP87_01005 [Acidobacteriia bacterium]|nr:hypothetical protein [Terriglobia bacterium]